MSLKTRWQRWIAPLRDLPLMAQPPHPVEPGFSVALFVAALLPRLYVALGWAREPVWDGHYYHFGATRIAQGLGYSEDILINGQNVWKPWCHYPVGYSGMLGWIYKLTGAELWVAPVVNAVLGAATVVVVYGIARHCLRLWRARLAALLCALHPGLILYTAVVMTESLSAFLLALCGYAALYSRGGKLGAVLSGLVLGLGTLVRPPALLAGPWLLAIFRGSWRKKVLLGAVAALVALLTILPWTLRNCRVMDGCALVSTNGGWNLAIGAMTETGRFGPLSAKLGCPGPGQVSQDRCWGEVGRKRIAEDPAHWFGLMPKKLAHTYNHESFAVAYLAEADPASWPNERKWQWQKSLTIFHHLLMLAATLSTVCIALPSRRRRLGPLVQQGTLALMIAYFAWAIQQPEPPLFWLFVVAPLIALARLPGAPRQTAAAIYVWGLMLMTSLTHAIFFGEDRYHLVISPLLCVLAAGTLRLAPPSVSTPARLPHETQVTQGLRLAQRVGARLLRALAKLGWLVSVVYWGYRRRYGHMGPLHIAAYRGYGTQTEVVVRGRVLEALSQERHPAEEDGPLTNFGFMWRRFNSKEVPDVRVLGTVAGASHSVVTDDEGYFELALPAPRANTAKPDQPQVFSALNTVAAELEITGCPVRDWRPARAVSEVFLPSPTAEFAIISDIDDTIIQTHVTRRVKMLLTTLLGNAYTRLPFVGTTEWYRALVAGAAGNANNPIFYVSKSPWNLYDFLVAFLDRQRLPPGPLLLRDIGLNLQASLDFKTYSIDKLLNTFRELSFVLVGDNGERDPDIYSALALKYPGRVRAIYIRQVADLTAMRPSDEFVARARSAGCEMLFISHAHEAWSHAHARGWVASPPNA